ncbi:MAG TPA: metallophosphoesterase [Ramlibacter sp.]|nr:metallophosphoesterase [Ramlibacter sp.]
MASPSSDRNGQEDLVALRLRIGRAHLRHRLGLEDAHEGRTFRKGTHFFHLENWLPAGTLIHATLTLSGLRDRGRRNTLRIELRHNRIVLGNLPASFEGYTLLHLSDLHLDLSERHQSHLAERVQGLACDVCVLTGDYRFAAAGPWGPAVAALERLRPHLPERVFAVLGNHDSIRMVPRMEALGMRVLLNESVRLARGDAAIHLAGIDDAHYFRAHNLHKAADAIPEDGCAILLSHTPEPYRIAAHCGFGAMLCGHTHGGQICLPGGVPVLTDSSAPRALARGPWRYGSCVGYTSAGCGSSIIDARFNCPPEITLHRLDRAAGESDQ